MSAKSRTNSLHEGHDPTTETTVEYQPVSMDSNEEFSKPEPESGGQLAQPLPKAVDQPSPRRVRFWFWFSVAFTLLAPIVSIVLGITLHDKDMTYPVPSADNFDGRTLNFEVVLVAADPKDGTMKVDWTLVGEEKSPCRADNLDACTDVNVFFDTNVLASKDDDDDDGGEVKSSDRPDRPLFKINARGFAERDILSRVPTFRTNLALYSKEKEPASLIFYPFDRYTSDIVMWAREVGTNESVAVRIGQTRPGCRSWLPNHHLTS
ncbi:hypothetical protein CC2G_014190 [Coprinopsis cinerea AmutBmut pab1-1]|nr:hypothetical protein CC2G_014190 [Coprinopsis cinerea AmutBmut pab1-1]